MRLPERALAVPMARVAAIAREESSRELLVALADAGVVQLAGPLAPGEGEALRALRRMQRAERTREDREAAPIVTRARPDIAALERAGDRDRLAGEVELQRHASSGLRHGDFLAFVGWAPRSALPALRARLSALGAALVELPAPRGIEPPTLPASTPAVDPFRPLVSTYGTAAYRDVDPTPWASLTFLLMFGIMFADVGDGLLLLLGALALRQSRAKRLGGLRRAWPLIAGAGVSSALFGLLYGELFGPTGVIPALWMAPLSSPTRLLVPAVVLGGVLMAVSHAIGIVNRWRENGAREALTAASGAAGLTLLVAFAALAGGFALPSGPLTVVGACLALLAIVALAVGYRAQAGAGPGARVEVAIRAMDSVLRTFANVISFARLAAFGLMHAALGEVVFHATRGLSGTAGGDLAAAVVFVVGTAIAFALEGLVATVQALRLEYYELFSRVFAGEGRPFRPWRLPVAIGEKAA